MAVIVFADTQDGKVVKSAHEAVYYGAQIASATGTETVVVTYGNVDQAALSGLGAYGANRVLHSSAVSDMDPQKLTRLVADAARANDGNVVVFSHDYTGKSVAPRVAAALNAGLVTGAVSLPDTTDGFSVEKAVFSGKAFATYRINSDTKVVSVLPNSMDVEAGSGEAAVEALASDGGDSRIRVKEVKKKGGDGVSLTEAELVVSAGRGLKGPENWGMIEELADLLGAATACSRPVADIGWRPHHEHVGQTGIAIRPNLYIAVGISGAIQHLAGVNGSKVIVVINTDKEAPFFNAADYGIVGDAFDVVPKLVEAVKARKANA